jgi:hypothetical protein
VTEGALFYFAVVEWAPPLPFPALAHDHGGSARKQDESPGKQDEKAQRGLFRSRSRDHPVTGVLPSDLPPAGAVRTIRIPPRRPLTRDIHAEFPGPLHRECPEDPE